jgi:undecaprenyl-diphosphatase
MTPLEALFLATIQGLTEFLPISSSGHLVLFQKILGMVRPPIFFDILLHLGTLGSIVIFFRKEIGDLFLHWRKQLNTWLLIFIGSIPAALAGFLFNSKVESAFNSLLLVGMAWIFFGGWLLLTLKVKIENKPRQITWKDSLFVGVFQALALLPGISRSGSTISAGLMRRLPRESAFRFSFLLAIPAILGATILEMKEVNLKEAFSPVAFLSMLTAGVTGYLALVLLQKTLKSGKFYLFGFYCLAIGALTLLLAFGA